MLGGLVGVFGFLIGPHSVAEAFVFDTEKNGFTGESLHTVHGFADVAIAAEGHGGDAGPFDAEVPSDGCGGEVLDVHDDGVVSLV